MINKKVFNKTKSSLIKINIAVVLGFLILFSIRLGGREEETKEEDHCSSMIDNRESAFYLLSLFFGTPIHVLLFCYGLF